MTGRDPQNDTVTLADLASETSLSVSTVSRALRGASGVDAATRKRVRTVAALKGYRVTGRRSRTVAPEAPGELLVLSSAPAIGLESGLMAGISRAAVEENHSVVAHQTQRESPDQILDPLHQPTAMRAGRIRGILLLGPWPTGVVRTLALEWPVVSLFFKYDFCDYAAVDPPGAFPAAHPGNAFGDRTPESADEASAEALGAAAVRLLIRRISAPQERLCGLLLQGREMPPSSPFKHL